MIEREMLELAAKAAGIEVSYIDELGVVPMGAREDGPKNGTWNPITDDGDCARMEAKLMVDIKWYPFSVVATASAYDCTEVYADHDRDRAKARRYASTRAAAEIGKAMAPGADGRM
jgi:hypothetical protein